jgi:hypothetical protein
MADQTNTPQKNPPEGSREVIDRELARQDERQEQRDDSAPRTDVRPSSGAKEPDVRPAR